MNKKQLQQRFSEIEAKAEALTKLESPTEEQRSELAKYLDEMDEINGKLDELNSTERKAEEQKELRRRFESIRAKADDDEDDPLAQRGNPVPGPRKQPTESRKDYARWPVEDSGQFFRAVRSFYVTAGRGLPSDMHEDLRASFEGAIQHRAPTGMGTLVDNEGGFLIPSTISAEILEKMHTEGQLLSRVTNVPITVGNTAKWNAITENARTSGNRYGGITVGRTGEGVAASTSKVKTQQIALELKKMAAGVYVSEEGLEDGPQIASLINTLVPKAFIFKKESEMFEGDGSTQMQGILNAPALVTVNKETGQAAATVIFENIVNMWSRLWAPSRANAVWFINQDVEPSLMKMFLAVGTGGVPVYLPANGLSGSPFGTLMGRPVIPVEHASTLGTVGDIVLADMSQYLYATKGGMRTAQSIHVKFLEGETVFRFMDRDDGKLWWPAALTPAKGSNTQSPFVALATRS